MTKHTSPIPSFMHVLHSGRDIARSTSNSDRIVIFITFAILMCTLGALLGRLVWLAFFGMTFAGGPTFFSSHAHEDDYGWVHCAHCMSENVSLISTIKETGRTIFGYECFDCKSLFSRTVTNANAEPDKS